MRLNSHREAELALGLDGRAHVDGEIPNLPGDPGHGELLGHCDVAKLGRVPVELVRDLLSVPTGGEPAGDLREDLLALGRQPLVTDLARQRCAVVRQPGNTITPW